MGCFSFVLGLVLGLGCPYVTNGEMDLRLDRDGDGFQVFEDCDDFDPDIHPGAAEPCDGIDNNCDGVMDEVPFKLYRDADEDGWGGDLVMVASCKDEEIKNLDFVTIPGDCDDERDDVYPGAEVVCDGMLCDDRDFDCDGKVDCDADMDGHASWVCGGTDSDDDDPSRWQASFDWVDGWDDNLDGVVDVHLEEAASAVVWGTEPGWLLACSVSLDIDLNNDTFADMVLGAKRADLLDDDGELIGEDAGAVVVVYGPLQPEMEIGSDHPVIIWGREGRDRSPDEHGDQLGTQVLSVEDQFSDGSNDLMVLSKWEDAPGSSDQEGANVGVAYLLAGPIVADTTLDDAVASWYGVSEDQSLTSMLTGDINGDSFSDFIFVCTDDSPTRGYGSLHIFPRSIDGVAVGGVEQSPVRIRGQCRNDRIGQPDRVRVMDFTGDGLDDLIIGSPNSKCAGGYVPGAVWVVPNLDFAADEAGVQSTPEQVGHALLGERGDLGVGKRLCPAGDMNQDGYDDLLVTGESTDDEGDGRGSAYLVFGWDIQDSAAVDDVDPAVAIEISGTRPDQGIGYLASSAGDFDGDGIPDIMLGGARGLHIFTGPLGTDSGFLTTRFADGVIRFESETVGTDILPYPVVGGDLDGDGLDDIAVPNSIWDDENGRVSIFFGAER